MKETGKDMPKYTDSAVKDFSEIADRFRLLMLHLLRAMEDNGENTLHLPTDDPALEWVSAMVRFLRLDLQTVANNFNPDGGSATQDEDPKDEFGRLLNR